MGGSPPLESRSFGKYRSEGQFLGAYFSFGTPKCKLRIPGGIILSYQVEPLLFYVEYETNVQSGWKGLNGMERKNAKLEDA